MNFAIISVGTELNLGLILNTNSKYIAEKLTELGFECNYMITVRDNENDIVNAVKICIDLSDFTIISGGLGPTDDDITRRAVARSFNRELIRDKSLDDSSTRFLKYIKNDRTREGLLRQSYIPSGSIPIRPRIGSASGFIAELDNNKFIFSIPGVPREMKDMFDKDVIPFIKNNIIDGKRVDLNNNELKKQKKDYFLKKSILFTTDISESQIEFLLKDIKKDALERNVEIGITANPGMIKIILIARSGDKLKNDDNLKIIENEIRVLLKKNIYGKDNSSIGDSIKIAIEDSKKSITISTAESITGGLISSMITDTPGSSTYFKGSIISYTNYVKEKVLGIDSSMIEKAGAVSKEVCIEMAEKAKKIFGSDYAIGTTGVAGPTVPEKGKDIGLIYCSIIGPDNLKEIYEKKFVGTRADIKFRTAQFVLNRLRLSILNRIKN